jgi:hypothetical protein
MGDWRKMHNGELHAFTKYYECDQLKDEMCGTRETNMGRIGNNIYSDLNGKNCLEDQGINGRIKQVLK